MNAKAAPNPRLDATLSELAALGMRAARVVTRLMEIEQQAAEVIASVLPATSRPPESLGEAEAAGRDFDAVAAAMAQAVPRVAGLAVAFDRLSRSVRRSVALMQRMAAGWPRAGSADDRHAMLRRQVARGVADAIRRETDGEAAERLFDDLAERLDDPVVADEILILPVEEVVRRMSRDLGLGLRAVRNLGEPPTTPDDEWRPLDTC